MLKVVLYICTPVFFAASVYAVATSAVFWDVCADLGALAGPLQTDISGSWASFEMFTYDAGFSALLHEAANFVKKMAHHTMESIPFAEVVLAMRKSISRAHAWLDVLEVDITILNLLPGLLILAASSALVIEGYYVLPSKRGGANSTDAGEMVSTALPAEPDHEPMSVGIPAVSLCSHGFRGAVRAVLAALTEAAIILFKMACYTVVPLAFADLVFRVREVVLMWGAQAGLDLSVVEARIWEFFPFSCILVASCALLTEGYYMLSSKRLSANSNDAGRMASNTTLADLSQPKDEQLSMGVPAFSLRSCGFPCGVRAVLATLIETGAILTKMACYIIVALHSADVVAAVRKVIFVWSAQAGLDLPVVDARIQELLPLFLTFAASFAMVVEGYHVLVSMCTSARTNFADMTANAAPATHAQPKHEQVSVPVTASNSETQKHADKLQPLDEKTIGIVADSTAFQSQVDSSKTPETITAAHSPSPKRQVVGGDGLSNVSQRHDLNNARQELGNNVQTSHTAPITIPDAHSKTMSPTKDAQKANNSKSKKVQKQLFLDTKKASTGPKTSNSSSSNRQVEAAPALNSTSSSVKSAAESTDGNTETTKNVPSNSKAGGRRRNKKDATARKHDKPTSTHKAAGSNSAHTEHKPAAVKTAVDWDDGYLAFVRALLKRTVVKPCVAQLQLALCLDRLLCAVPAWMLTFGAANNQGCTASAGLEVFKSLLNGKGTKGDLQLVLGNVTKAKSMALLMRTVVAADVQGQLKPFPSSHESDGRLMAMDVLRLRPEEGMPEYFNKAPEWHLKLLHEKLTKALQSL